MTNTQQTITKGFEAGSPLGQLDEIFEASGYAYRPSYFGARLHAERWMDDTGTSVQAHSYDGDGHFILSVENQRHDYHGSTYATNDGESFGDGARRALALARRFSTLARRSDVSTARCPDCGNWVACNC